MAKITVRLSSDLLAAIDRELVKTGVTRSAAVRRTLEQALRRARETKAAEVYVKAYREFPQTDDELGWSDLVTRERLADGQDDRRDPSLRSG